MKRSRAVTSRFCLGYLDFLFKYNSFLEEGNSSNKYECRRHQLSKRCPEKINKDEYKDEGADKAPPFKTMHETSIFHHKTKWQKRLDYLRAIQWWNRNHIKESQQDVYVYNI